MAIRQVDVHSYSGMGTAFAPASLPANLAQYVEGFTPSRRGRMNLAPVLKHLQKTLGIGDIHGSAIWLSSAGQGDRLLLFHGGTIYTTNISPGVGGVYNYDERDDGQHSFINLGSLGIIPNAIGGSALNFPVTSIQFQQELIFQLGGILFRYYVDTDGIGSEHLFKLGVSTPRTPTLAQTTGGNLTLLQTYSYLVTYVDELGRESSPSIPTAPTTLVGANNAFVVTQSVLSFLAGGGETTWNIYRLNPGGKTYNLVTNLPLATTSFTDTLSDNVVNTQPSSPSPGENDPATSLDPTFFLAMGGIFEVWKDRLITAPLEGSNIFFVSNAGSATQFSSLPLPINFNDGLRVKVGGRGQNEITGVANLGSLLAVFGRETTSLFYGDDISTFSLRPTLARGCQNYGSVQRCENQINFLSDDGVYAVGYEEGYAVKKISSEIEDIFRNFEPTAQRGEPTAIGRPAAPQVQNALLGAVNSLYSENRYYLSFGNRTLCYDMQTQGWTDTGWGFIKTVSRYFSQMDTLNISSPETIFLTLGDPLTYNQELRYFTVSDTPKDFDSAQPVPSRILMRPVAAGNNQTQAKIKRPALLVVYGKTGVPKNTQIGTARWYSEDVLMSEQPIYAYVAWRHKSALFELVPPSYTAEIAYVDLKFTVNDLVIENMLVEFSWAS